MIHVSQPYIGPGEIYLVNEVLRSNQLTSGPMVRRFEEEFARLHGVRHAVACTSGTTALHLALAAAGIGPGDEVLVPDLTYVATANAVLYTGAKPVLVDVDPRTWGIDPVRAEHQITPRTRAILPVHLYGCAADMTEIALLADRHGLVVIEDAAEGLGGFFGERRLGACSDAGCFSFYGNKIMTTGEGGMVITNNNTLWSVMKRLRGMAQDPDRRYYHTEMGFNYRMTDLQAAVGVGQLGQFESLVNKRREIMRRYKHMLLGQVELSRASAPWLFTCLLPAKVCREDVMKRLAKDDIETRPAFTPLHHMRWLDDRKPFSSYYVSEDIGQRGLSLPTWPGLTSIEVETVATALLRAL